MTRIDEQRVLGLVPARGGSKSIPLKNIAPLGGLPMITYVIRAAQRCPGVTEVVCSTDHDKIAAVCEESGVSVIWRPDEHGRDDSPVIGVIAHVLERIGEESGAIPAYIALLQPTSPFLLPEHIAACVEILRGDPGADSAQTITPVFHNAHAFNQRIFEDGRVEFRFLEERRAAYNKQRKPKHYLFGNLVVTRSTTILAGKDCFGDRSLGVEIPRAYSLDVDGPEDLDYANFLIDSKKIAL